MMKKVVNTRFAKTKEYRRVLNTIEAENKCPFCPENFKYHKKPILKKLNGWIITGNSWPYKNAHRHFLIISQKHKEHLNELTEKDLSSANSLASWAVKKFNIEGGLLAIRFGDTNHTGASVCHLHFHLVTPSIKKSGLAKTVMFPIG